MTIKELDNKYFFNWKKIAVKAGVSYITAKSFRDGKSMNTTSIAKIINALPITPIERAALIETMFAPPNQ